VSQQIRMMLLDEDKCITSLVVCCVDTNNSKGGAVTAVHTVQP
jgi:hypothetical protein